MRKNLLDGWNGAKAKEKAVAAGGHHHTRSPLYFNASCVLRRFPSSAAPQKSMERERKKEHPQLKIRTGGNNFFTLQEEPRDVQQRALLHISLRSASDFLLEGEKQTPKTQSTRVESLISYRTWGKKRESTRHKHSEPLKTKAGRLCQLNKSLFFLSPQVSKEIFHTNFDPFRQVYTEKLIYV